MAFLLLTTGVAARSLYAFSPPQRAATPYDVAWTAPVAPYEPVTYAPAPTPPTSGAGSYSSLLVLGAGAAAGLALGRSQQVATLAVSEDTQKVSVGFGAACVGGLLGVYLTGEITTAAIFALVFAYATTKGGVVGDTARSAGSAYDKVYTKTVELNDEFELTNKAAKAADFVVAAAQDVDESYQITARVDEKLKLSQAADSLSEKFDGAKAKLKGYQNVD